MQQKKLVKLVNQMKQIGQSDETKEISTQTDKIQRKSFPAEDKNVRDCDVNESINETIRNEERIARNK